MLTALASRELLISATELEVRWGPPPPAAAAAAELGGRKSAPGAALAPWERVALAPEAPTG